MTEVAIQVGLGCLAAGATCLFTVWLGYWLDLRGWSPVAILPVVVATLLVGWIGIAWLAVAALAEAVG